MKRIPESPERGLHRQLGHIQDACQDRVASDETQLIQPWKPDVQTQHDSQHEPVQVHGTGNPLACQRLLHQGREVELLQHGDHRQQSAVGGQTLTGEVIGRGSIDFIGFRTTVLGTLFFGRFLVILDPVCNHLGDLLEGRPAKLRPSQNFCFTSMFRGSPNGSTLTVPQGATSRPCIAQVQHNLVADVPGVADFTDPNLVNAWGIVTSATSPFWVCDAGTGLSTVYTVNDSAAAAPFGTISTLKPSVPGA